MFFLFNKQKTKDYFLKPLVIYLTGVILFALILIFTHRLPGDDLVFPVQIKPFPTVFDWVNYRYQTWSGRIFAEAFEYIFSVLPLIFWKIVSLILYATSTGFIFLYYRLFSKKHDLLKDRVMISLALILPFMMDSHVISDGVLWVSASMNYFWLTTFALVGFYPYFYVVIRKRLPHWLVCITSLIATIIATSSQEQIGSVFVVLAVIFTGYILLQHTAHKKSYIYLVVQTFIALLAFIISIKAPGDQKRVALEASAHLPDFYTTPLPVHIEYAYRWFIDGMINRTGLLLAINWLLFVMLFIHKKFTAKFDKADYVTTFILALSFIFLSLKGFNGIDYLFTFYPEWKTPASHLSLLLLIPWTISLIATLLAPIILYRKKSAGLLLSLLFAASLAATLLITFSPSMYASGIRVLYIPSFILVLTAYYLFDRAFHRYRSSSLVTLAVIVCLAVPQYLLILGREVHHL